MQKQKEHVLAKATPFNQMGFFFAFWYALFSKKLTLKSFKRALNDHWFCLGTSGSGKSRFITGLAQSLIKAGHSLFLIDTSSDPVRQVLYFCIKEQISPERVVILDATREFPVPDFHLFEVPDGIHKDSVVDGFLAAQRGFLGDSFGERQADILRMLAYTFVAANAPFLPYSVRFLTEEKLRNAILKRALQNTGDRTLSQFWEHMTKQGGYNTVIESSRNKLNALAMNNLVFPYFDSNTSTVDLYSAFNEGNIILLNLSENHYKDRSSRALLGALFLFLAHQALLRRELDDDEDKNPVSIVCDEAHQYYVSDFVLPFYTGSRKHNVGIKLFSQSCNNFPQGDIDVFLSTAAHVISFGISHRDAQRIAMDLAMPHDELMVKGRTGTDLYGGYGDTAYWSMGEQQQHVIAELMRQGVRKLFWRVRSEQNIDLYLGTTGNVEKVSVSKADEDVYRAASAACHAKAHDEE